MDDCIFCKIVKGEIPCYKIYEDDYTLAFLDIAKEHYGHTLVVPKKHYTNILDCDEEYLGRVVLAVQKIANHYVKDCNFKGVNVLNANGKEAGQSVFHLHFHIIPRNSKSEFDLFPHKEKVKEELIEQMKKLKMY
ncbi:MAG: HIT family protein [Clostridia bacterium]|nr:HIT family protein [Clostridia bacterium]